MLKQVLIIASIIFSIIGGLDAQTKDLETIISRGVAEYELGNYEDALNFFKQAYKYDKSSSVACYELALTHLALKDNENAALFSGKLITRKNAEYQEDAYLINGSAWENLGREHRARKIYKEGIKKFPGNYLLRYNLALSLFNSKEYDEAQKYAISAVELAPDHGSSHLLLAYIMFDKGERVKSMLPLYYFLLIEQDSDRSTTAYDLLTSLWEQGVTMKGQREIMLVNAGYKYSDFGSAELAISLMKAAEKSNEMDGLQNKLINFAQNNQTLFKLLSEAAIEKEGFWWDFYVDFFTKIEENNLSEPFSYFISSCKHNEDVLLWLSEHHKDFQRFTAWMEVY
ncbi:tetratricopeptide repeat protein [Plebeiibacterium sediminum]|uniref:Tetratricopeptide repeat protein n=1 Tax=Plebeiibacterium sediminum TaxID=2992112 RepID=A0AAE3SFQ8_9BACT|nr:tetratricopeptide repeat protein [Plebeiobacterium sediminum]MCW3787352.1 tetratricopeptide repeat protein [Plebeiobacterium sediminum]